MPAKTLEKKFEKELSSFDISNFKKIVEENLLNSIGYKELPSLRKWADNNFVLNQRTASITGKWKTFGYQREIFDALQNRDLERVSIMKSARVGYSKMISIFLAYNIVNDPASALLVQPTIEDAKGFSKDEIQMMSKDVKALRGKLFSSQGTETRSTILQKAFAGGVLYLVGANSPTGFRRITVRDVLFDEVDGYPPTTDEGDQIKLGEKRALTFPDRKFVYGSTPTTRGVSRITDYYEKSDMRKCHVPCPNCNAMQELDWKNLVFDKNGDGSDARFVCTFCDKFIDEKYKLDMIDNCKWIALRPEVKNHAGFHIWVAYSPLVTWSKIAEEFINSYKDPEQLKTFINTVLGQAFTEKTEAPDFEEIIKRKKHYKRGEIPANIKPILTCGVDVQNDRIECEVVAWCKGMESYSLDYYVFQGKPEQMEVFQNLETLLKRSFGGHHIKMLAIDSGYATHNVYMWAERQSRHNVAIVKGFKKIGSTFVGNPRQAKVERPSAKGKLARSSTYYPLSTYLIKKEVYSWLNLIEAGECYMHFPIDYEQEYYKQLTSEYLVKEKLKNGQFNFAWRQSRERNEALDCRVYARAAASILQIDKITPEEWDAYEPIKPKKIEPSRRGVKIKGNFNIYQ